MSARTVLITGCSSGFGKLTVKKFHQEGWNVVATMRSPEKETELGELENVLITQLDVVDPESIKQAVEQTLEMFGRIDALVNNAGYGGYGLFEQFSDEAIRAMYETNVFGLMNVTRAVLPFMRQQREGAIINVASLVGIFAPPTISIYSSTKFAVKGFTEGLALELSALNIKAHTVNPGAYDTGFHSATDTNFDQGDDELKELGPKYAAKLEQARQANANPDAPPADPQEVADVIFKCATEEMPIHNNVGNDTNMIVGMRNSKPEEEFLGAMKQMLVPEF